MKINFINNISNQLLSIGNKAFNLLTPQERKTAAIALLIFSGLALLVYFLYRRFEAIGMNQQYEEINDQPPNGVTQIDEIQEKKMSIDGLPVEMRAHILSFVDNPLLTAQVSRDWQDITQTDVLTPLLRNIEDYLGEKRVQAIYQQTVEKEAVEVEQLSDRKKLHLLFQDQRKRLSYLLGMENANVFLGSQTKTINLTLFITQEQWIKDYNFILMCNKIEIQGMNEQAADAIEQVKQQRFDISLLAKQLRDQMTEGQFNQLQRLFLSHSQLTELPPEVCQLVYLQNLDLSNNQLTELPKEFSQLVNLEELSLSYNQLTEFPQEVCQLIKLEGLGLSGNPFTVLPPEVSQLVNLEGLVLRHNQVNELPEKIGPRLLLKQGNRYGRDDETRPALVVLD